MGREHQQKQQREGCLPQGHVVFHLSVQLEYRKIRKRIDYARFPFPELQYGQSGPPVQPLQPEEPQLQPPLRPERT